MAVTIRFDKRGGEWELDADVPPRANRLVLADREGREHHFGRPTWYPDGPFTYAATYGPDGREHLYSEPEVVDALQEDWELLDEPVLGAKLPPLVMTALAHLDDCRHKGFASPYEREKAILTFRALWEEAHEPFDPAEVEVWALTFGFRDKDAQKLVDLAERVRQGRSFRGPGGMIRRDPERERKMVAYWRSELEAGEDAAASR